MKPYSVPPSDDYAEALRDAIVEAEAEAADDPDSMPKRCYAMGLRTAAGLYGLPEGTDPKTRRAVSP